jgi:hypothetical protein
MTVAVEVLDHQASARALLTDMFRGKPVIEGLLDSFTGQVQELEVAVFDVILLRLLPNAALAQLDTLGALVGEPREGRSDTDYREAIKLRIRVNRAQGKAEDVIHTASISTDHNFQYDEWFPAGWEVTSFNIPSPNSLARLLGEAKAAGTRGTLVSSIWPVDENFVWDSVYGGVSPTPGQYNTVYGGGITPFYVMTICEECVP